MRFGDYDERDGFDAADGDVSWRLVDELARQVAFINMISDDRLRLGAARKWAAELETGP